MMMSEDFKAIIEEDIHLCSDAVESGSSSTCFELQTRLISKYGRIIDGFSGGLEVIYDDNGVQVKKNITTLKQKLELFKAMGYENHYAEKSAAVTFNNTNRIEATVNISFADVRKNIEKMTALEESDIQEILEKVDTLEKIVSSSERKSQKWAKAKDIVKWVADKGVDVGIAILPLIMKIGQ